MNWALVAILAGADIILLGILFGIVKNFGRITMWFVRRRSMIVGLACFLFLSSPCFATDYFLDLSHDQAAGGDGTTMETDGGADDAFKTFAEAYASIGEDDVCWIRRATGGAVQAATIAPTQDGKEYAPAYWIGWPRDSDSLTSTDWTNGSTTVNCDAGTEVDRECHQARFVTGPDGFDYLITDTTAGDGGSFVIDRPYAGTTANNQTVTVKADVLPNGITKPTDTQNWDDDPDDLPCIDFNDGAVNMNVDTDDHNYFAFLEFKDSTVAGGVVRADNSEVVYFKGCLFLQSAENDPAMHVEFCLVILDQCIIEGSGGANGSQVGLDMYTGSALIFRNGAMYNMGDCGIYADRGVGPIYLENLNIGVEAANSDNDIQLTNTTATQVTGRDVKLGGTNGDVSISVATNKIQQVRFANNQKTLGGYKQWNNGITLEKVAVTDTNANKKLSDNVLQLTPDTTNALAYENLEAQVVVWESRKTYDADTYNIKVWIYNDTGNTLNDTTYADDICMRCRAEAGNYGDATTEYVSMPWTYSDEIDIEDADVGGDDWDYLQCDSVVVGTNDSKIYCEILVSTYDAGADVILIDPQSTNP